MLRTLAAAHAAARLKKRRELEKRNAAPSASNKPQTPPRERATTAKSEQD